MPLFDSAGYVIERILSDEELAGLRSRINVQIHSVLRQHDLHVESLLENEDDPLKVYHNLVGHAQKNHGSSWIKKNRILNEADAEWFENTEGIAHLRAKLGAVRISDEECIGRSNYYWRLTRPWAEEDVGPIHRDEWFWLLNNNFNEDLTGLKRVKVWIAIQTVPNKNGLLIQPYSHQREDVEWEGRNTESIKKPVLLTNIDPASMKLLNTPPGFGVIFHDRLLHGGALNQANECRCSIEFTLLVPKNLF
jgi:hypothetical protein